MSIREISFPSANGRDTIKAWSYSPLGKPKAIVQLIHGYGEHSRRYLHMISKFNEAGFVVFADDHLGHGKTGYDGGTLGDPHSGGYMTYPRMKRLCMILLKRHILSCRISFSAIAGVLCWRVLMRQSTVKISKV